VDCEEARAFIDRQLDEALAEAEAGALEQHVNDCSACSVLLEESHALVRGLADLRLSGAGDAAWDALVTNAVAEGAARLHARRERRITWRLALATTAVWLAAWLVGTHARPRVWTPPPAPLPAAAEDVDLGPLYRPVTAIHVRPSHDAAMVLPRSVAIERLLAGEDDPNVDQWQTHAPATRSPGRSSADELARHA